MFKRLLSARLHRLGKTAVASCLSCAVLVLPGQAIAAPAGPAVFAPSAVHVFGWGFNFISAMAVSGPDLFVANKGTGTVDELAVSTMALVRVISGPEYFDDPAAMVALGGHVFVVNTGTGKDKGYLTELDAATGALVRLVRAPADRFDSPVAIVASGQDLFVANEVASWETTGWVTEIDASTGALVRVISGPAYHFAFPDALAADGNKLFVANPGGAGPSSVTEVQASNGKLVRVMSNNDLGTANAIAVDQGHLFVSGGTRGTVVELSASSGRPIRVLSFFHDPSSLAVAGSDLIVADPQGGTSATGAIVRLDARTGAQVGYFAAPRYGLSHPTALGISGEHLFVGNTASLTEMDTQTRSLTALVTGSGYDFQSPNAMAAAGPDLFVLSATPSGSGWVTELRPSTGALVSVFRGKRNDWDIPEAIAVSGHDLFVANSGGLGVDGGPGFVAEYNTLTGAPMVLSHYTTAHLNSIDQPDAMTTSGNDLFIANWGQDSVTEVDISTGSVIKVLSGSAYHFNGPDALAVSSKDLFVASAAGGYRNQGTVTEIDISTGAVVRTVSEPADRFYSPDALVVNGPDLFVVNYGADPPGPSEPGSVSELDISTGAVLEVIDGPAYHFATPEAAALVGHKLLVANARGASLTQVAAATGAVVSVLSGGSYHFDTPDAVVATGPDVFVANQGSSTVTELQM